MCLSVHALVFCQEGVQSLSQYGRLRRYGKLTMVYPQDGQKYDRLAASCLITL